MAWATPRTWTTGDVATAAQFNQDLRDNLQYLWGGDGTVGTSTPQRVYATGGTRSAAAFNTFGALSFSSIDSTTYSSPSSGTAVPLTETGIYLVTAFVEAFPLTGIGGVTGMRVALNGTVPQGFGTGWFTPYTGIPSNNARRLLKLAAAGTLSLLATSLANSATTDQFGSMAAERVA